MFAVEVPYQRQFGADACGAAALAMVYASFGLPCIQQEIWPRTATVGLGRSPRTKTWLMCADALSLGFAAVTIKAREPWQILQSCAEQGIRAILNHRLSNEVPLGHYSVLVAIDDEHVELHDPQLGPSRSLSRDELLDLWGRRIGDREITGRILLAIDRPTLAPYACRSCGGAAHSLTCPGCRQVVPVEPGIVLRCLDSVCGERTWEQLFCPHCDYALAPA